MTAEQIIEEIQVLPAPEQAKIVDFLLARKFVANGTQTMARYASIEEIDKIADEIFAKHHLLFKKLAE